MGLMGAMFNTKRASKMSREKIIKLQNKRLKKLVKYARSNSSYFEELYKDIGSKFELKDLSVVNKVDMMNNFNRYVTDDNINLTKIEEFTSNVDNVGHLINEKYLISKTSGSTGNPAIILYDKNNIDVASAVAALRTFARKEDLDAFLKNGKKSAGIFASHGFYLACGMSKYMELKTGDRKSKITIDVNQNMNDIVKELNEFQPSMLSGYPCNLSLLCNHEELDIKPNIIITGGELLTDEIREKLKNRFNCYVQTHYSCTEAGEIACECSCGHLHINEDWVIVEAVDRNNNPVSPGVLSDKILITNLANYVQPFIRYELSDRVVIHDEGCPCGNKMRWLEVEGRTDDILEFENGIMIAPMSFYKIISEDKRIKRFQLIQKSLTSLELRLVCEYKEDIYFELRNKLISFLNANGVNEVAIILSNEEPQPHKESGKFNHIYRDFKVEEVDE
jgi:phenylacetate-coenzyme A ligase PaaK-like adenylate-forming protein